ncbi:hypothetical protein [Roseiconus lacunae]|uniref:Uncharacterized protein n=1 Tax=Roseiconus lacunae TaxID=2605694 RepID=A0ABT7PFD2_9BACT|nr:hypothetical protein [Roseiconus lacunae]MDM4015209.1 hypothetical protein [Roseiconus lacunae]
MPSFSPVTKGIKLTPSIERLPPGLPPATTTAVREISIAITAAT